MAFYLKKFEAMSQYDAYTADTENFIKPNVSLVVDNNTVRYNPIKPETKLVVYYDIQDISSLTTVCTNHDSSFKSMEIDGVESVNITTQGYITYQFDSVGEHVIKYEFNNPTRVGNSAPLFNNIAIPMRVIIPNTFTSIGSNAFGYCNGITTCTISSGVTSIDNYAFKNCSGLTSIDIPDSVTSIGNSAFYGCTKLTSIDIPSGVTSIDWGAFSYCTGLTTCTIGSGVVSIGGYAFESCTSLTSAIVNATTPPTLGSSVFDSNASGRKIYVPSASVNAYKAAPNWSAYASDIEPIS